MTPDIKFQGHKKLSQLVTPIIVLQWPPLNENYCNIRIWIHYYW